MGINIKPSTALVVVAACSSILACIAVASYHWKQKTFTHHGDPHHDAVKIEGHELLHEPSSNPHALDHVDPPHEHGSSETTNGPSLNVSSMENKTDQNPQGCREEEWKCNIRLNENVKPKHYELYLNPDIKEGTFDGRVSVQLNITASVDHIRLHTKDLKITYTVLYQFQGTKLIPIPINNTFEHSANEFLVVIPSNSLLPHIYKLTVDFSGNLTKGIVGLYRAQYFEAHSNVIKYVVTSKFQPTYARRAFPCFDEPSFKSTFSVSLVKPTNFVAISNMPVSEEEREKPAKNMSIVHFEKSVPMVTYLLAFAIGDFDRRTVHTKRGIPVSIYATKSQVSKVIYATEIAPKIVDFYEDYFDFHYPLPKMDIVAIPDFVSGAMEHWGMISFRESNLLYQTGVSSAGNKQRIASVIAHEIAHMWFGNLMTLKWWNDLWLNEGFASYMEYKGVNHVHPDWDMEKQFVSQDLTPVLVLDGQFSSHPIVQTVSHPDQITEIFDTISYNKGASVIRMLEAYMGEIKFRDGVRSFLRAFSFKNAETPDLWIHLQAQISEGNVSLLMDSWTKQMGYPVLTVSLTNGTIHVTQQRFVENRNVPYLETESPFGYKWEIPLRVEQENETHSALMHYTDNKITIPIAESQKWFKINSGYEGYFRVNYHSDILREIKKFYSTHFTAPERCGLLDDIFSLASAQYVSFDAALDFGLALSEESHLVPWDCMENHLFQIGEILENSVPNTYAIYRKYVLKITSILYGRFSWEDTATEKHMDKLLKIKIFSLACTYGHVSCLETTKKLFKSWLIGGPPLTPSIRPIVYKWGMRQSDEVSWEKVFGKYLTELDSQERVRLITSLASTQESWILRKFVHIAQNQTIVRRQDYFTAMKAVANNPVGNPIIWSYYRNNYEDLAKRFTMNDRYFGRMILDISSDFSSKIRLQEMEDFFKMYPEAGAGKRARNTALETVKNNIKWARQNGQIIHKWLEENMNTKK